MVAHCSIQNNTNEFFDLENMNTEEISEIYKTDFRGHPNMVAQKECQQ